MTVRFVDLGTISLAYECLGTPQDPTVLLVGGLGQQLIGWDPELCRLLVERGWRVVRYDNRDVGLSTHLGHLGPADLEGIAEGREPDPTRCYRIADMAGDAVGLLDRLGVRRAHVLGASMGGMIAQQIAIDHPDRVRSLTSVMSTPGPAVAPPTPEAAAVLLPAPVRTAEDAADQAVAGARIIGSPGYPTDPARLRRRAVAAFERSFDPQGVGRQLAAILISPDRTESLSGLQIPTLVIHGTDDPLIPRRGGEATARATGGRFELIDGMAHDLPPQLYPRLVDLVDGHLRAAERAAVG